MSDSTYPEDRYLKSIVCVSALLAAKRIGLLERVLQGPINADAILQIGPNAQLLLDALISAGVLQPNGAGLSGDPEFLGIWRERGPQAEARLEMTALVACDALQRPEKLFGAFEGFMSESKTFNFFRYDRATQTNAAHIAATRPYCDYVCALTSAEAPYLLSAVSLEGCRDVLEIGGNTGELAAAVLTKYPTIRYCVMDMPAVCHIGSERHAAKPWSNRLRFLAGDARSDPWPNTADVVLFKSVLHDWPEKEARRFLSRAREVLGPGGRVMVMERAPLTTLTANAPTSLLTDVVFAPFFRPPELYATWMADAGFEKTRITSAIDDPPFYAVEACVEGGA